MASFIAAIDQGTTSTRCIIVDKQGTIHSVAQKEHAQIYPKPGWVEHDPEEIWQNTLEVIAKARIQLRLTTRDIAAIGITNQRETTVVWNRKTGKPYYNAIVWQDVRTEDVVAELAKDGGADRFRDKTGLPLATYFSALKLGWLLNNVPGLRDDAERGAALFGTIDSFLIWNLTGGPHGGEHVTDVTNASRTQLMNLQTLEWDDELLAVLNVPRAMLPAIRPSSGTFGTVTSEVIPGVPITGVLGDQQAALVGQTCFEPGQAKNTYGTGCFLLMNTGTQIRPSTCGLLTTVAYQFGTEAPHYALEGSVAIAGALVQWLRDNLGIIQSSGEVQTLAEQVDDNGGTYIVPAFSGLYAPYWRTDARGIIAGLTRFVTKNHIARAALEATAFQTYDVLQAMQEDAGVALKTLRVDGGMVVNDLLMQFQADINNVPVIRPRVTETTAIGAAYAAGLAVGYWSSIEELKANWGVEATFTPVMPEDKRVELLHNWKKAIERSFDWAV
ncbi:glycerol kinase GlpK [Fibrella forsythiae]|uniref:Glycerol kinase n=1 Tax=Fibrella forsythiae TaxID=2817061 RepID=A0ABS3JQQ1_9BACT|nr:glycerol kinase GlpK [Fibrella forsythiae]MBO0951778.1 glycerol kinase GlpK [Fibrella forsythiae]